MSMRLFEIANVERMSAIDIARQIIDVYHSENPTVAEYNWLIRKSEDEYAKHLMGKAMGRYSFNYFDIDSIDGGMLDDASELAQALNILTEIEEEQKLRAETKIKQATDEFLNSEEIKLLAQQKAYADLQNTYAKHVADNNAVVSNLAQQANTL